MQGGLYIVNPRPSFPMYFSLDCFEASGLQPATQMADLAGATVAALASDHFEVELCDETVSSVDYDTPADTVAITGKITQRDSMIEIAERFRLRGKTVVMGGPLASLSPEVLRPHCDILVIGEIEEIADELFAELREGRAKDEYRGTRPDLGTTPEPRWDLYPNDRALVGSVQTTRGCPFGCEFCDVIQYVGRRQRHKPVDRVLAELDRLRRYDYGAVFLADDNFTVYRSRAKELLEAIRDWNRAREQDRVSFLTQLSIDVTEDEELLNLCAEAGLTTVFVGVETPNEESLRGAKKRQNVGRDLVADIQRFFDQGIYVLTGMIVGFDADDADAFRRQYEFAMSCGVPVPTLGALVAPAATPLHARLESEGRLKEDGGEVAASPWSTNVIHPVMSEQQLMTGIKWLANKLYAPGAFARRVEMFLGRFRPRSSFVPRGPARPLRRVESEMLQLVGRLSRWGPGEERMFERIMRAHRGHPQAIELVFSAMAHYVQVRHMLAQARLWDPSLVQLDDPPQA